MCHVFTGQSRAVPEQQADAPAAELSGRQLEGAHVRQRVAARRLRRRDAQLVTIRHQGACVRDAGAGRSQVLIVGGGGGGR